MSSEEFESILWSFLEWLPFLVWIALMVFIHLPEKRKKKSIKTLRALTLPLIKSVSLRPFRYDWKKYEVVIPYSEPTYSIRHNRRSDFLYSTRKNNIIARNEEEAKERALAQFKVLAAVSGVGWVREPVLEKIEVNRVLNLEKDLRGNFTGFFALFMELREEEEGEEKGKKGTAN